MIFRRTNAIINVKFSTSLIAQGAPELWYLEQQQE